MPARIGAPVVPALTDPAAATDPAEDVPAEPSEPSEVPTEVPADAEPDATDTAEVEAPVAAAPADAPGKALVLVEGGKVTHAPESVLILNVDTLLADARTADDLFETLRVLGTVAPSGARDALADRVSTALRGRLGL
jgi:hypothetical protein